MIVIKCCKHVAIFSFNNIRPQFINHFKKARLLFFLFPFFLLQKRYI